MLNLNDLSLLSLDELKAGLQLVGKKLSDCNLLEFVRMKLKTTYDGRPFIITPFYLEWYQLIKEHKRLKIECSRDHGKSNFFSYAVPLWLTTTRQNFSVDIFSYSEDQSKDKLRKIRAKIESDKDFHWLFPPSKSFAWSDSLLEFPNGSSIGAFGFGSSYRGRHPDVAIIDDPSKDYGSIPINDQENFLLSVIEPAVGPRNQIFVTGTPVENDDLLERLDGHQSYKSFKYPARDQNGKILWQERYTNEDLEQAKMNAKHEWIFQREYLLNRHDMETASFKSSWIKMEYGPPSELYKVITVDPAITRGGDSTAFVVTGTDWSEKTYVLEGIELRTNNVNEIIEMIFKLQNQHEPGIFGIETYGFQRLLKYWVEQEMVKRNCHFTIVEIEKGQRNSKENRILELQPKIQSGMLVFCGRAKNVADQVRKWNPKSSRNKDDLIDALAYQVQYWQSPGQVEKEMPENCYDALASKLGSSYNGHPFFRDFHFNQSESV